MKFFEDLYFVRFCEEISFEKLKKSSRKHQKGGNLGDRDNYSHEKSSTILNRRNVPKNLLFLFYCPFTEGGDETRSLSLISYSNRQQRQLIL